MCQQFGSGETRIFIEIVLFSNKRANFGMINSALTKIKPLYLGTAAKFQLGVYFLI